MQEHTHTLKTLFQQEFAKMVAVISRQFGLAHIELAEDIVSETFLTATEEWERKGLPENPAAWLYAVARQKTLYHFRRNKIFDEKIATVLASGAKSEEPEPDFSGPNIKDSQLRMLFAVCDPKIAGEAQIGLALRILCGFGIDEIAAAFLSNKETVNKRLFRAKEKLRTGNIAMELPPENEIPHRLDNVLHIIYLLFNEGYYSTTQDQVLRKDLCLEALRLGLMLTDYDVTNLPKTNALIALMCFHASRFDARQDNAVLYEAQDDGLWDRELILRGMHYLERSIGGSELTSYHLEAQIAWWHCQKEDTPKKWQNILQLYNSLLMVNYSPAIALNRTFALYKANGWEQALAEAQKLRLEDNHFYHVLLGELYKDNDLAMARLHLEQALQLARSASEKAQIKVKLGAL